MLEPRAPERPADAVAALEVRLFLEAIHECYGYDLRDYALPSMSRRVHVALARSGLSDLGALQHRVLTDAAAFARVLADLTVQVTELFRDPSFYGAFRARVVPVLRTYPLLNVWHAGCATGEEAYSTAILLREEGLYDRCQLYATDLSPEALERAKEGVYAAKDLEAIVDGHRRAGGTGTFASHATVAYGQVALKESLRQRILFFQHDLVSDYVFAEMQVVFCRNVLIYFGRALRERVLEKLARSLCPGGFLCLGSSERLPEGARGPFVEVDAEARIYRLRGHAVTAETLEGRPAILIVDDIEANLVALEAQLANLDCDIVRARSGNEALRQLLRREFAVMLLDVQMPDMDGYEVARLARDNRSTRDVPIVFVTAGHETEESLAQGYGSGAIDYLFKPINAPVLRSKVQVFLELHVGRRRLQGEIASHERTLAELEAFNYSVSHDLRAPLRPLDGFCAMLLEDYGPALDDKARETLGRVRAAARRMGELIDDLLELSRIGRAPVRRQAIDLAPIVETVVRELRESEPARDVEIVVPATLPAQGDARLLQIVLENLLRNAWKFTRERPRARIEIGVKAGDEVVHFVRDDGVGFDPAYAARMFQPFQRFHAATQFEGTGIGLAIVSRIVGGHGGRIWAESSVGGGACFSFTLAPRRSASPRRL